MKSATLTIDCNPPLLTPTNSLSARTIPVRVANQSSTIIHFPFAE